MDVIVLTAKEELGDKLKAFNLGANDYLTKPFYMEELKARIIAILKEYILIKGSKKSMEETPCSLIIKPVIHQQFCQLFQLLL